MKGKIFHDNFLISFANAVKLRRKENKDKLAYYLPWSIPIGKPDEGIILLKAGALMRCYEFVCPDMDSASDAYILSIARSFNEALKHLEAGWSWHVECQRGYTDQYPGCSWTNEAGYLIDKRREENFTGSGEHFINSYILTLTKRIKDDIYAKGKSLLYRNKVSSGQGYYNWDQVQKEIDAFRGSCSDMLSYISAAVSIRPYNNNETITYLHSTCSTTGGERICPDHPQFIDSYITDCNFQGGTVIKVGDYYCPIISLRTFPNDTFPGMLANITTANVELRWTTRFIGIDREKVRKILEKYQKKYYGSTKNWGQLFMEATTTIESNRTDPTADENQSDAENAMREESNDVVSFGYYTSDIMVWDTDYDTAIQKAHYIISIINKSMFGANLESVNAFAAWLGMMPGNVQDNIRRPIISTGNCSHIIPLSSMWQGQRKNYHTEEHFGCGVPLLICSTKSGTPFFFNLNVRDVGHGFIFGPTGAGKSTLLCLLESQFLKYKGANVIILDKDKSARGITMASGGVYTEPGMDDCAFQPLRELETEQDITWCAEFIEQLLYQQHLTCNAVMREAIVRTLRQMQHTKSPDLRRISTFQQYVTYRNPATGENDIQIALQPYTMGGLYGNIFDASSTTVTLTKWLMIEMGTLMKMGSAAVTPALMYIFRLIEKIYSKPNGDPTGDPTLLVLDESWVFLDNDYFRKKIEDWLLTLRKKNVFCVFATQEVEKVAASQIATTIISQCKTKVYLADESARTDVVRESYRKMDLTDDEIESIASARMKRDYFYKSVLGCRLFQLDLDDFQLALIAPGNDVLDAVEKEYGKNTLKPMARQILEKKGFPEYRKYLRVSRVKKQEACYV